MYFVFFVYLFVFQATDLSITSPRFSTVACVITLRDVNDNPPQFVSANMTYVMEDAPIGYPVFRFSAHDSDAGANGHVIYSLASVRSNMGSGFEDLFFLHPVSGKCCVCLVSNSKRYRQLLYFDWCTLFWGVTPHQCRLLANISKFYSTYTIQYSYISLFLSVAGVY